MMSQTAQNTLSGLSPSEGEPGFDDRLAALSALASTPEESEAREAFASAWRDHWLDGAGPGVDLGAWAKAAQAAMSQRRQGWLGRSHHKPSGAGAKLPKPERSALKRAVFVYLIGLLQGDPKAFLEQARQLGGLPGLRLAAQDDPWLGEARALGALCKAAMALPEGESQAALRALLDLAAGCPEPEARLGLWLKAAEAAVATLGGEPPDAERFGRVGLPALRLMNERRKDIDTPARWALFMANRVCVAAAKAGGAEREEAIELVFEAIEGQGGAAWLLSGFGHQELLSWVSDTDEAARVAARCFAAAPGGADFWGVGGGFQAIMERPGSKNCARFYEAGAALFGPPEGPQRRAPLNMLLSQGEWGHACALALSEPPMSPRQAKGALAAALEGAREMRQMSALYGWQIGPRLDGVDWPRALLRLSELADPCADPALALAPIMALDPAFAVGVEAASLTESTEQGMAPAPGARRLAL